MFKDTKRRKEGKKIDKEEDMFGVSRERIGMTIPSWSYS